MPLMIHVSLINIYADFAVLFLHITVFIAIYVTYLIQKHAAELVLSPRKLLWNVFLYRTC